MRSDPRLNPEPGQLHKTRVTYGDSLADIITWAEQEGLDPETLTFRGGSLSWVHTETQEEVDRRIQAAHSDAARHREWVRNRYHELFPNGE